MSFPFQALNEVPPSAGLPELCLQREYHTSDNEVAWIASHFFERIMTLPLFL